MNIRLRLALTTLAMAVPALVASGVAFRTVVEAMDDEIVSTLVLARFSSAELDACEASPPATPIPITLPTLKPELLHAFRDTGQVLVYTYDRLGRSPQPGAPVLPPSLLDAVRNGAAPGGSAVGVNVANGRQLALVLPHGRGLCAMALAAAVRMRPPLPPPNEVLVPIGFALFAGLVGIWPIVRRIRSMTMAVRRWEKGEPLVLAIGTRLDELGILERALQDSAETMRRQHDALVARERALLDFIENTTHDLATPLTVLQGSLSAIAKENPTESVRQAMMEAQYIGALLGNLAVSAKFDTAGQVETSLDLREVVSRVVDRHLALARWLGVTLERSVEQDPVLAWGDPTFTERALANLVENAMRHNVSGGHVAVVLETEGEEFVLQVLDDGPGLTLEDCARAVRWEREGDLARSRDSSGGGLGLSIVARVAQLQGWRFTLMPGDTEGLVAQLGGPLVEGERPPRPPIRGSHAPPGAQP